MNICSLPSDVLARIFSFVPDEFARREQLPLTCQAFAAACHEIIWDTVRVDPRQYHKQTNADMSWHHVQPWLLKRAGHITGLDLKMSDIKNPRRQAVPLAGLEALLRGLPNLKDLTLYLHKPAERFDSMELEGEAEFVAQALTSAEVALGAALQHAAVAEEAAGGGGGAAINMQPGHAGAQAAAAGDGGAQVADVHAVPPAGAGGDAPDHVGGLPAAAAQPAGAAGQPAGGNPFAQPPAPGGAWQPPPHHYPNVHVPPPLLPSLGLDTLGLNDFRAVCTLQRLRRLELDVSLRSAALGVAAVQAIARALPHLEELYVEVVVLREYGRPQLPFPDALLRLPRLRRLSLQIPCEGDHMPDGITKLTTLQHLALNAPFVPRGRLPPGFGALPLTALTLWGAHLPDDRALRELAGLTKLEMLSLGNCGLRAFPTAIQGLTKLQWADLGHNCDMGASLALQPATLLTRLTRLATLQVRHAGHFQQDRICLSGHRSTCDEPPTRHVVRMQEPACIAAMPLLRGSTGRPLPAWAAAAEAAANG